MARKERENGSSVNARTIPLTVEHTTRNNDSVNAAFCNYLETRNGEVCESKEGNIKRSQIISKLQGILEGWVCDIAVKKTTTIGSAKLRVFGSQRLGCHNASADIDCLCLAPNFVTREDFFSSFVGLLRQRRDTSLVFAVPAAYTPVVKFNLDDQPIDLLFVSLSIPHITEKIDELDISYLQGLDHQGVRSINGPRVAESIVKLVPYENNFRHTLQAIKFWAKQRGIFSNVLGFLGGVNYAIMVVFICQKYPRLSPATLVCKFFNLFVQWQWPNPILISPLESNSNHLVRNLPIWNPKLNVKDGHHIMPIITPAYPAMNSSYNVGIPQFRLIQEEILRAQNICHELIVLTGSKSFKEDDVVKLWDDLFQSATSNFFQRHPRYIQVEVTATCAEDHRAWFGWCESRLRLLFLSLEQPPLIFCHPQANCFHRHITKDFRDDDEILPASSSLASSAPSMTPEVVGYSSSFFIGLSFRSGMKCVDVNPAIQEFLSRVNSWASKKLGMDLFISAHTKNTLPSFVHSTVAAPSRTSGCTPTRDSMVSHRRLSVASLKVEGEMMPNYDLREFDNCISHGTSYVPTLHSLGKKNAADQVIASNGSDDSGEPQFADFLISSFGVGVNN